MERALASLTATVNILVEAVRRLFKTQEDTTINATDLEARVTGLEEQKLPDDETSQQGE